MAHDKKKYPDVSEIFRQKAARRRRLADLTFEEKIAIVKKWRRLTKRIKQTELSKAYQTKN